MLVMSVRSASRSIVRRIGSRGFHHGETKNVGWDSVPTCFPIEWSGRSPNLLYAAFRSVFGTRFANAAPRRFTSICGNGISMPA